MKIKTMQRIFASLIIFGSALVFGCVIAMMASG